MALFAVAVGCNTQAVSQTGSWGDQGDRTYKNPMLNADYPDVDIEQVGDTYYMITSTNHSTSAIITMVPNAVNTGHFCGRPRWSISLTKPGSRNGSSVWLLYSKSAVVSLS